MSESDRNKPAGKLDANASLVYLKLANIAANTREINKEAAELMSLPSLVLHSVLQDPAAQSLLDESIAILEQAASRLRLVKVF